MQDNDNTLDNTNFQENNNFETIISSWRRMSADHIESSVLISMSGDSSQTLPLKKKDEESSTLVLERPRGPIATAASAGVPVLAADPPQDKETNTFDADHDSKEDKFIQHESEENKDAGGDASYGEDKDEKSFLEDDDAMSKSEKSREDKVDSVYLRPPPAHKVRSNASTTDNEEDCGIKCLYYTLQCCDCVLQ